MSEASMDARSIRNIADKIVEEADDTLKVVDVILGSNSTGSRRIIVFVVPTAEKRRSNTLSRIEGLMERELAIWVRVLIQ